MASFDDNTFTSTVTTAVTNSFNDDETNTETTNVSLTDAFNEDTSVADSGNTTVDLTDSFHNDSHNTDIDMDHSGNTDSYNEAYSFSFTDESTTDNSVNAGVRSYSTGFDGVGTAAAGSVGGDLMINNQNTIVDQSLNGNVASFGSVHQVAGGESVVASGTDSMAAGDDIRVDTWVDQSTSISADGDVLIDSEKTENWSIDSGNTTTTTVNWSDSSQEWDIDDSGNSWTSTTTVTDSFTSDSVAFDYTEVDLDLDVIVDSTGAINADDIAF